MNIEGVPQARIEDKSDIDNMDIKRKLLAVAAVGAVMLTGACKESESKDDLKSPAEVTTVERNNKWADKIDWGKVPGIKKDITTSTVER